MTEIEIVPIAEGHAEGFHAALDAVARERKYLSFLEAPPLEATRAFVRGNIALGNPQLVALSGGAVVGWCDITRKERPVHAHCGSLGMGLLAPFRNCGHGEALIRATVAACWAVGLHRIELTVFAENIRARRLYERVGFRLEGEMADGACIDGMFQNVFLMGLVRRA